MVAEALLPSLFAAVAGVEKIVLAFGVADEEEREGGCAPAGGSCRRGGHAAQ